MNLTNVKTTIQANFYLHLAESMRKKALNTPKERDAYVKVENGEPKLYIHPKHLR